MSINDLEEELGLEDEVADTSVVEASVEFVETCRDIYEQGRTNDVEWRWQLGAKVQDAYFNKDKYEKGILKTLEEEIGLAVSDLSRFRKFHNTFDLKVVKKQAAKGYTWSHFKILSDMPDTEAKKNMIIKCETSDDIPKTSDLQKDCNLERENEIDPEGQAAGSGASSDSTKTRSPSPSKPINAALRALDKLGDYLADITVQRSSGIDFDTDAQEEKYNEGMAELNVRLSEIEGIRAEIFKDGQLPL
jgi:hypothetical protein